MKLADMLGAGLPVAALDYGSVLGERFRLGEHGVTFTDAHDLGATLASLLRDFRSRRRASRLCAARFRSDRSNRAAGWTREARPVLAKLLPQAKDGLA